MIGYQTKLLAIVALSMLAFAMIIPAVQVYAQGNQGRGGDDRGRDREARERENKDNKSKISEANATQAAIAYLTKEVGPGNYVVEEVEDDDGKYVFEISDGVNVYKIEVDARGKIVEFEVDQRGGRGEGRDDAVRAEQRRDEERGRDERRGDEVKEDKKDEEKDKEKDQDRGRGRGEEVRGESARNVSGLGISLSKAREIALKFLEKEYGPGNYTVEEVKLSRMKYKIEISRGDDEFEFEIDARDGKILKFEAEIEDTEIKVENEDKDELKVKMKDKRKDADNKNSFNINLAKEQARITTNFNIRENETKSQLQLQLFFTELMEFIDNGAIAGVFDENDTVVSTINLNRLRFSVNRTEILSNGTLVEILAIQNGTGPGLRNIAFIYHLIPSTRNVTFANETVASVRVWEIKFDIEIVGFEWVRNDTMLALTARFNNQFKVRALGDAEVKFETVDRVTPFFNWGGNASADGSMIMVNATVDSRVITLSYPHFNDRLVHDPRIGYTVESILESIVLVPMIMAIGAIVVATAVLGTSMAGQHRVKRALRDIKQVSF